MKLPPVLLAPTSLSIVLAVLVGAPANAIQLDDPNLFQLVQSWSGATYGVPGRPGAIMFSADGATLFVVGDSETASSALYALPVMRDPASQQVTGFGQATLVFSGDPTIPGLDAGLDTGPEGTLFYTYWDAHFIGQRPVRTSTVETVFDMTPTGVPSSVAGLTFSPHLLDAGSNFAQMQVSSWLGNGLYNVPLTPLGGGRYQPGTAELFVALPQQGTGAIQYVPQGRFTGNLMYVNWDFGEVRMLVIDHATGLPIDDDTGLPTLGAMNPRDIRFAYELGTGPWGLEFDPLTLDFFVTTWNGAPADSIIQFTGPGFANQAPMALDQLVTTPRDTPVAVTLTGLDPDMDPLTFNVVRSPVNGAVTGTTADVIYTPDPGFVGMDLFSFAASDGLLTSTTATVTVTVTGPVMVDAGGELDAGAHADVGVGVDSGVTIDSGADADSGAIADGSASTDSSPGADLGTVADAGSAKDSTASGAADTGVAGSGDGGGEDDCSCNAAMGTRRPTLTPWLWFLLLALVVCKRSCALNKQDTRDRQDGRRVV